VRTGDVNHDGKLDLVVSCWLSRGVSILLSNGDGSFSESAFLTENIQIKDFALVDINGDTHLDVITANEGSFSGGNPSGTSVGVYLGNGDGSFGPAQNYTVDTGPRGITASDFNGDGKIDFATANWTSNT